MIVTTLLIVALVCFILATANNVGLPVQFGWLGAVFVVLSWLVR